jgi:hypothetical protein
VLYDDLPSVSPEDFEMALRNLDSQQGRRSEEFSVPTGGRDWTALLGGGAVPEGKRNDTIARVAGHLLYHNVDLFLAAALIAAFNESRCRPPLPGDELQKIIESIGNRELTRRRSAA